MLHIRKHIQTILKALIMIAINFFVLKYCQNNAIKRSQTTTLVIKNLVRSCSKFSKTENGNNLNMLIKQFATRLLGKKASKKY